jgi:cytochrome d ubiquinol oxidase subunit I
MSITAYYILRGRHVEMAKKSFALALYLALISSIGQLVTGHFHALKVAEHQPAKLAAFEGHFETGQGGAPLHIIGIPDQKEKTVRYSIAIPGLLSWLAHMDSSKPVTGLDQFPERDWPPVALSFVSYHVMVGLGMYFILLTVVAAVLHRRGTLFQTRWLLWVFVFSVVGPYISNQLGWMAAEVGRQPWIVYGLLRTSDAYSRGVPGEHVAASIGIFVLIYLLLTAVWIYVMNDKIQHGPDEADATGAAAREGLAGIREAILKGEEGSLTATAQEEEDSRK